MDYEEFYQPFKQTGKSVSDNQQRQQTVFKSISKNAEKGDLKSLSKDLAALDALISEYQSYLTELRAQACGFDAKAYMQNGDFVKQMLAYCADYGVDAIGEYPSYEIFPFKVKIDGENQDVYMDKKKVSCARPQYLVADIKQNKEKLMKARFYASAFLNELADAYDKLIKIKRYDTDSKKQSFKLLLKDIYYFMTPMQRFRRDYDLQSFALDLARLYASGIEQTSDGRQYQLGPARGQSQMIRILNKNGEEWYIGTIEFFPKDVEDTASTESK